MKSPTKRVALRDIAERAGLSIATVSMALRDSASLSPATIARVKRLADEMNYAPDPALAALASYRRQLQVPNQFSVIALLSDWDSEDMWIRRNSARQVLEGAGARAARLGYTIQHFWVRAGGASAARIDQILQARGIRGVILAPFQDPAASLELAWDRYSVVALERPFHYAQFHHVVPNHFGNLMLCWQKLRERGYRRIGLLVQHDLAVRCHGQWEAAFRFAQFQLAQGDAVPVLQTQGPGSVEAIRRWLREHRPQAVISRCDDFFHAVEAEGLRVPDDIGYASLNVSDDVPACAGIEQHRDVIGASAVDALHGLLARNQRGANRFTIGTQIDGSWRPGGTLAVPAGGVGEPELSRVAD